MFKSDSGILNSIMTGFNRGEVDIRIRIDIATYSGIRYEKVWVLESSITAFIPEELFDTAAETETLRTSEPVKVRGECFQKIDTGG